MIKGKTEVLNVAYVIKIIKKMNLVNYSVLINFVLLV